MKLSNCLIALGLAASTAIASAAKPELDPKLPAYTPSAGVTGNISSIGSDTLNNLMTFWAESFQKQYPSVKIGIEGKGSATAPPALIQGTAQLGPMSRPMKREEVDAFEKQFGYKPTEVKVAIDALAVFVHKDNPATALTLKQVDSIFSSTRKRNGQDIVSWKELPGSSTASAISLYGRNSASGTYGFFKEHALQKGDFKNTVKEQPGSSAVVQAVASDSSGIGYSGIGYMTSGVKPLALSEKEPSGNQSLSEIAFAPTYENCLNGKYPLARFLTISVNKAPNKPLDPLTREFLKFVLSREGQEIVLKDGYFPLPAKACEKIRKDLGI